MSLWEANIFANYISHKVKEMLRQNYIVTLVLPTGVEYFLLYLTTLNKRAFNARSPKDHP